MRVAGVAPRASPDPLLINPIHKIPILHKNKTFESAENTYNHIYYMFYYNTAEKRKKNDIF